jgi:hypothetical protein
MKLRFFDREFSICRLRDGCGVDVAADFFFLAKTPDEVSLVCPSDSAPPDALAVERGWRMFRVEGRLDFALVGILAGITRVLAEKGISVFAASTFDTDYVLIKEDRREDARDALRDTGYDII